MEDTITRRLQEATGLKRDAAANLTSAVIRVLADQLPAHDRAKFIDELPTGVARPALGPAQAPCESTALFYQRVGAVAGLPAARAIEVSEVVCAALVDTLRPETRVWLAARLPPALDVMLSPRDLPSRPPEAPRAQRRYPTLAEGHPGSTHPLGTARADQAQRDSIARSENPHGNTKLASSPGQSQSREHQTLAEANPRPTRPLSTGKQ